MSALQEDSVYTYDGDDFYLELTSSNATKYFDKNRTGLFSTYYPTPITLGVEYDVSLEQIVIPTTWMTFPNAKDDELWMHYYWCELEINDCDGSTRVVNTDKNIDYHTVYFPEGCFTHAQEFLDALIPSCGACSYKGEMYALESYISIKYLSSTNKFYFSTTANLPKNIGVGIRFSPKASEIFGFPSKENDNIAAVRWLYVNHVTMISPSTSTLHTYILQQLNISLDILRNEFHQEGFEKHLYSIDIRKHGRDTLSPVILHNPIRNLYKKVCEAYFSSIQVTITDEKGSVVIFSPDISKSVNETVTLLLHFKARN